MTAYGLTDTGFIKKRQPEIKAELEISFRTLFGAGVNLLPTSIFGQIVGIFSEREALLWELLEDLYNSNFPDTASGASLDNAVALTGTSRLPATFSSVTARVFGTLGTLIPANSIFSVVGVPANRFVALQSGTVHAGINEVQTISFSATPASGAWQITFDGQATASLAFNASNGTIQTALNALSNLSGVVVSGSYSGGIVLTFAGSDGEQDQPLVTISANTLQDGGSAAITVTPAETQKGFLPHIDLECRAETTGAVAAAAGTLTVIETPLFGLDSVTNLLDAVVGRNRETDAELRLRRLESLQRAGTSTVNGIVTTIRQLTGVDTAFVFENNTDVTDGDGRPPHSYEVFVQGGTNQEIFETIWETKPAGIQTFGNLTGSVIDSQGFSQTVKFSRPNEVLIYLGIELVVNTDPSEPGGVYPTNGDDLVRDAILAYGAGFEIGQDVVLPRFFTPINTIPGIVEIVIKADTTPAPSATSNISIDGTEYARFDASRTTVVSV